jgi:hypothetical protein
MTKRERYNSSSINTVSFNDTQEFNETEALMGTMSAEFDLGLRFGQMLLLCHLHGGIDGYNECRVSLV